MNELMHGLARGGPWAFGLVALTVAGVVFMRYFIIAGVFNLLFYSKPSPAAAHRWVSAKGWQPGQQRRELMASILSSGLFGLVGACEVWAWQRGFLKIYLVPNQYGWGYLPISLLLAMLLQETYYYWLHRLMHHPRLFRLVHRTHHLSHTPSVWSSFAFHPIEALLQAVIFPLILLVLPMQLWVVVAYLTLMTLTSAINHLNVELYPPGFNTHRVGRWLIGATHHGLHHQQYRYNYGLYFTFWDKWMGTESPQFAQRFTQHSRKQA